MGPVPVPVPVLVLVLVLTLTLMLVLVLVPAPTLTLTLTLVLTLTFTLTIVPNQTIYDLANRGETIYELTIFIFIKSEIAFYPVNDGARIQDA